MVVSALMPLTRKEHGFYIVDMYKELKEGISESSLSF